MSKFKYLGTDNALVGRFGRLKKGSIVDLWESEAEYVLSHPCNPPTWVQVKQAADEDGVGTIVPRITKHYDLTRVFWLRETFAFLNRQSRSELLVLCRAFREIGAKVKGEADCQTMSREALKEMLYGEVKRLQWTDHSAAPVVLDQDTDEDEDEETDTGEGLQGTEDGEGETETTPEPNSETIDPPTDTQPVADTLPETETETAPKKGYREIRRNIKRKPKTK